MLISDNDAVAKTIQVYEKYEKDAMPSRYDDVSVMKKHFDYFIRNLKDKKVLDVGCGLGNDSKYLSENELEVTGVDLTKNFVEAASKNAPLARFRQMDMRNLKFAPNSFDGIWVSASLLHIPKSEANECLRGFHKILCPKGLLYIGTVSGEGEEVLYTEEYGGMGKFYAYYSKIELSSLLENSGFEVIKATIEDQNKDKWLNVFATKS